MRNWLTAFIAFCCLTACQRPVAYFQRTAHAPAARLHGVTAATPVHGSAAVADSVVPAEQLPESDEPVLVASVSKQLVGEPVRQIRQHTQRISQLTSSASTERPLIGQQPKPKPKPKMRLGNRIRDALGMPLRQELNWWQRISWKLKASVIIILVAVLFAILHITILAIIFGIVAAFLLISGLRRSFKVRRPWF